MTHTGTFLKKKKKCVMQDLTCDRNMTTENKDPVCQAEFTFWNI